MLVGRYLHQIVQDADILTCFYVCSVFPFIRPRHPPFITIPLSWSKTNMFLPNYFCYRARAANIFFYSHCKNRIKIISTRIRSICMIYEQSTRSWFRMICPFNRDTEITFWCFTRFTVQNLIKFSIVIGYFIGFFKCNCVSLVRWHLFRETSGPNWSAYQLGDTRRLVHDKFP